MRKIAFLFLIAFSTYSFSSAQEAKQDDFRLKCLKLHRDHQHCVAGGGVKVKINDLGIFFVDNTGRVLTCDHIAKSTAPIPFSPLSRQEKLILSYKQDEKEQKAEEWDGKKVYDHYKDVVVDVDTKITFKDGMVAEFGGSGWFHPEGGGLIGTCAHVVKIPNDRLVFESFFGTMVFEVQSYEYSVVLVSKNRKYKTEMVGVNVYSDTALLRALDVDPADYKVAKIGDPKKLKIDDKVYAMGSPYGLSGTFTTGKISGLNRYLDLEYLEDYIQADVSINSGNSGGPLINSRGEVVGINVRGAMNGGNLVLAVPMTLFKLEQLKAGEVVLPWFGMEAMVKNFPRMGTKDKPRFQDLDELYRKTGMDDPESLILLAKLTDPNNPGIEGWAVVTMVEEIKNGSKAAPAKIAGFKKGDLIKKIDGKKVQNGMDIRLSVLDIPVGKEFEVELTRIENGGVPKNMMVKVTLQKKSEEKK